MSEEDEIFPVNEVPEEDGEPDSEGEDDGEDEEQEPAD